MVTGRNPKYAEDYVDPISEVRDPNDGLLNPTPEWVEWHLSKPLTQAEVASLRAVLIQHGDDAGLTELFLLERPTRFDHRRLSNAAEAKYATASNLKVLSW